MTLWTALRRTYAESWRFVVAFPIIAVVIFGAEGLQHVAEWLAGMYESVDAFRRGAHDPGRMTLGIVKVGWLLIVRYWVSRFIASGGSASFTLARDLRSVRQFAWVSSLSLGVAAAVLLVPGLFPAASSARRAALIGMALIQLVLLPIGTALAPWGVGAAIGDRRASPLFAFRRSAGSILWGIALSILAIIPVMAVHYALGLGAIGRSSPLAILMLGVDAVFVGYLGVVIHASEVMIAERMARRSGETLLWPPTPSGSGAPSSGRL